MKALILSAAAALAIPTAASSSVVTIGGPLAVNCYKAALNRITTREAFGDCDRALAEEPLGNGDRAATLVNRGILYMIKGRDAAAEQNFQAATRIDPSEPNPWLNRGFLRLRQGNGRAALPLLERAIELRTGRPALAYYARGIAHEQVGDIRAAYRDLLTARELDPDWDAPAQELTRYKRRGG